MSAARKPAGWPGWPLGKRFAVVLTHDVEGAVGINRCRQLLDLEQRLGFRSSFNFVPEGHPVPAELRFFIENSGFEVGVHDLRHEGHLFSSRKRFSEAAVRINQYLKDWDAVGFRAGFMMHELSWLHELNILYDASTFDTDPFEPQPDGVGTIFPFWMSNPSSTQCPRPAAGREPGNISCGKGYVELPYTLPQDSTLFLILEEPDGGLWKRKVDWIAESGGMVLVNVHPDYLHHSGKNTSGRLTVLDHYSGLLSYLNEKYQGAFWHVLPREMAAFVRRWKGTD